MLITLKDGSKKEFAEPITVYNLAAGIAAGLARRALAAKVDDKLVDLDYLLTKDATLAIITPDDQEALEILRHSTSHLMAQAVKELFPAVKVAIGPNVEDGFYYDFFYPEGFSEEDLKRIEIKMQELAKKEHSIKRKELSRQEAIALFTKLDEKYKIELIEALPEDAVISCYEQGGFIDLCRGPHLPSTSQMKYFKLMKVAGAYWRGDSNKEMLQRIYGTAWLSQKELAAYLLRLEEAKKRDHRTFGRTLDLFHLDEVAPGMVFWHANGWTLFKEIRNYIGAKYQKYGYQEVNTPTLLDRSLWEKSGHWEKFAEHMFVSEAEKHTFALKPMNCPCHIQIFKQGLHSYRDLPMRLAEFGSCMRKEDSGALHGIMRVRGFVQDDGHIFCTEEQIYSESLVYLDQLFAVYADFGFKDVIVKLATRPAIRAGSDEVWDKSEKILADVLTDKKINWILAPGDGAFYGPKIEISLKDCLGRVWQCGTLQVDCSMPERLGAYYIAEDGSKKVPVMLHRAMLGSLERFIGILLEETAANLPVWLAPTQVVVLNITSAQEAYTRQITENLINLGFRARFDLRNEKIGYKIREHTLQKVPYLLVIGDKEVANSTVAVRSRDGKDLGAMPLDEFAKILSDGAAKFNRK